MLKRKTTFKWTKEFGFISRSRKDDFHTFSTVCHCDMEIGSKKKSEVYQHTTTDNINLHFLSSFFF